MKKSFPLILLIALAACRNQSGTGNSNDSLAVKKDTTKKEPFYPVTEYIQDQIAYVDSTPLPVEMLTFVNNKRVDSVIIDRKIFRQLAEEFLKPNLNDSNIKPNYSENSYHDLTINTLTFNYTTTNRSLELQQTDVLLDPDTRKVKNVIFRKSRTVGDTLVSINGLWKNNMNFQLNYNMQPENGKAITKQIKVIWDKPLEQDY